MGGFFGALARHGAGLAAAALPGHTPWGTLVVNLLGCFAIGVAKTAFDRATGVNPLITLGIVTGFLGAFTTFSTFAWDTLNLVRLHGARAATLYVSVSVVGGLLLCGLGMRVAAR